MIYCLVIISIDLSETTQKGHWKSEAVSETKKNFLTNFFFPTKIICLGLDFVSD